MNDFLLALSRWQDFSGRSRRREYWTFTVVSWLLAVAVSLAAGTIADSLSMVLLLVFALALIVPSLALQVRRLHDTDKSGWWFLVALVPFIGGIVLFVLNCIEGTRGANRFGADPKLAR